MKKDKKEKKDIELQDNAWGSDSWIWILLLIALFGGSRNSYEDNNKE